MEIKISHNTIFIALAGFLTSYLFFEHRIYGALLLSRFSFNQMMDLNTIPSTISHHLRDVLRPILHEKVECTSSLNYVQSSKYNCVIANLIVNYNLTGR